MGYWAFSQHQRRAFFPSEGTACMYSWYQSPTFVQHVSTQRNLEAIELSVFVHIYGVVCVCGLPVSMWSTELNMWSDVRGKLLMLRPLSVLSLRE